MKNADLMWKQSVWSSAIASSLASRLISVSSILSMILAMPDGGYYVGHADDNAEETELGNDLVRRDSQF